MKSLFNIKLPEKKFGLIVLLTIFSICLLLIFSFSIFIEQYYQHRIMPRVTVGNVSIGGLTITEAIKKLNQSAEQTLNSGFTFNQDKQKIIIYNTLQSLDDPDINTELVEYDSQKTIATAFALNRKPRFKLFTIGKSLFFGYSLPADYQINTDEIKKIIRRDVTHIIESPQNAQLEITGNTFIITPDKIGYEIDWENTILTLNQQLSTFTPVNISLNLLPTKADISYAVTSNFSQKISELIATKPVVELVWENKNWQLEWEKIITMINFIITSENKIGLGFKIDEFEKFINQEVKPIIDKPARNAKFEIQNGRVIAFQGSSDGQTINITETIVAINNNFSKNIYKTAIIISPDKAKIITKDANNLGITEIIGIGKSNFTGSPANRRHNIKVGAAALNGLLIKPNEEFSLISALGNIDAAAGYLPELVIKGNKTVPEYGGGLCQIGTTTFRATLASGLPILERRNHSYRVRYYEPAGTDATIYNPKPDYRFLNDTNHNILIQTRIEGDELIFEFWGTKDGRNVVQTDPKIYNIVNAPPTTYIETTDLAPGKQRCTESAHAGADAEFTYTVTYPSGETKLDIFKSHYKPWGAVCLKGVTTLPTSTTPVQTDIQPSATNSNVILTN
jgi:vancomycin resistance protein YoaR